MNTYKDLKVWQQSMDLAVGCYRTTKTFPKEEMYGMTSQIRRCASSIPANIAEGWGRQSTGDYIRFLRVSQGSLKELETHMILCHRIELINATTLTGIETQTDAIGKMLNSLIRRLGEKQST